MSATQYGTCPTCGKRIALYRIRTADPSLERWRLRHHTVSVVGGDRCDSSSSPPVEGTRALERFREN